MGLRVGIDLVGVRTVQEALEEHGEHYLRRVFTPAEVEECTGAAGLDPERLAARFAAKEAAMKVLEVGDEPVPWPSLEVRRRPGRGPALLLHGHAAELAAAAGLSDLALSFTHEDGYAGAVVVASAPDDGHQDDQGTDR